MEAVQLNAEVRSERGKTSAERLRRQGILPGVLYSKEIGSMPLKMSVKEMDKLVSKIGENALYKIVVAQDGKEEQYTTLLREVQRHPVKGDLLHVDFYQISMKDKLQTSVSIHLAGEPEGTQKGGILQHGTREVEVECLPIDLPDYLQVDVKSLDFGDSLTVADITPPEGVKILSEPETVVATIVAPRLEEEQETEAEAEAAEPEAETAEENEE